MLLAIEILKLLVSLAVLAASADRLVQSSSRLARAFGISSAVIGLTLIGYGTSLPEFAVSSIASLEGHAELSVSNIVGSNIFNIAILIGIAAFLTRLAFKDPLISRHDLIMLVLSAVFLAVLLFSGGIGTTAGLFMVVAVTLYTVYAIRHDRATNGLKIDTKISWKAEAVKSAAMLAFVLASANILVTSSINVARMLGVSEWLIGATIVAAGTSMPELAVTLASAKRKEFGILLGNIVGSNIFNILWILGFAALLNPLAVPFAGIQTDVAVMLLMTILFAAGIRDRKITRTEGRAYVAIYLAYVAYLVGIIAL